MRPPVAAVPAVHSARIAPVARRPQKTDAGRLRASERGPRSTIIPTSLDLKWGIA
jgi:hypothetical protein